MSLYKELRALIIGVENLELVDQNFHRGLILSLMRECNAELHTQLIYILNRIQFPINSQLQF